MTTTFIGKLRGCIKPRARKVQKNGGSARGASHMYGSGMEQTAPCLLRGQRNAAEGAKRRGWGTDRGNLASTLS